MINLENILKSYPNTLQTEKRAILREYLQYKVLELTFKSAYGHKLSFLWGTALRLIYNNQRFSEDLDFDNKNLSFEEFEKLMNHIKYWLELEGLNVEIVNKQKWTYHCHIKFSNILFENKLTSMYTEKILIKIDTFDQKFKYTNQNTTLNKFDVLCMIQTTPIELLLSQKILTAFDRKRAKWRDFFDILFILKHTKKPNYQFLQEKLGFNTAQATKEYILKSCAQLDFKFLQKDVQNFLFNPHDTSVLHFPELIKNIEFRER